MRVVDIGNGTFEERHVTLSEAEYPWIFAALRHQQVIEARLGR